MADELSGYALGEVVHRDGLVRRQRASAVEDHGRTRHVVISRLEAPPRAPLGPEIDVAAEASRALPERGVVPVLTVGRDPSGQPFVVSAIGGASLAERLTEGAIEPTEAVWLALDVARTLTAAHAQTPPLVHGGIRPGAIHVDEKGFARLLDFGLGLAMGALAQSDGSILEATARYHAPEHQSGGALSPASDVFALASVIYEAVSGRPAFAAATPIEVLMRIAMGARPAADPAIPPALTAALATCWVADPKRRASAARLVDALEAIAGPVDPRVPVEAAPSPAYTGTLDDAAIDPLDLPTELQTALPNHIPDGMLLSRVDRERSVSARAPAPNVARDVLGRDLVDTDDMDVRGLSRASVPSTMVMPLPSPGPAPEVVGMPDDVPTMRGASMAIAEILAKTTAPASPRAPRAEPSTQVWAPPPAEASAPAGMAPRLAWILVGVGAVIALLLLTVLVMLLAS